MKGEEMTGGVGRMDGMGESVKVRDKLHMRHRSGGETVTFEMARFTEDGSAHVRIEPDDQLDAGYYEAFGRLDRQSLGRLLHWLQTGVALPRDDARIPEVFGGKP